MSVVPTISCHLVYPLYDSAGKEPVFDQIQIIVLIFKHCFHLVSVSCMPNEFECWSGFGCFHSRAVCDGDSQCLYGSDEYECGM